MGVKPQIVKRFLRLVKKTSGCWIWIGEVRKNGYGRFYLSARRPVYAHRMSWKVKHGRLRRKDCILHHCDNRRCVRPSHLFLGTRKINNLDMMRKNRVAHGMRHQGRKLDLSQIRSIRRLLADGVTQIEIARKFGVTQPTISDVSRKVTWHRLTA